MTANEPGSITREMLLDYFLRSACPRAEWQVGMEVERIGRRIDDGRPLPYDTTAPNIRALLEAYRAQQPSDPIWEGDHLIGLDGPWGSITLEPGGQVEWSSRPRGRLRELERELVEHLSLLDRLGAEHGIRWLGEAVDPELPVSAMEWMPKARYSIMRPYLGARGSLAHRMMTQTAAIQCAFDYADAEDWRRKFLAASYLAPVATALFANSSRVDGGDSGYRSYRQRIWRDTDPDRCNLPKVVFEPGFSLEGWLDWIVRVPTIFRHRARGLVPSGGIPFVQLMERTGCDAIRFEDWETHVSTIFTEVRSYTYIEVRSADLLPRELIFSVPSFWAGLLYDESALQTALELGSAFSTHDRWVAGMEDAARFGLDAAEAAPIRELGEGALGASLEGLGRNAVEKEDRQAAVGAVERLAEARSLEPRR
jgi:glutamate--cysteine ligase